MRHSELFPTIGFEELAAVTGGCKKKQPPPPPQQIAAPQPQSDSGVEVQVATGAAAMQLINGGAQRG